MINRRTATLGLIAAGSLPGLARAQDWPQRPITLVHGFGAGGNADSIARVMAATLSETLGQQMVVEAKPGAGGNLASEVVSRATPDGHTLILLTGGHAVSAALYKSLRFKPVEDFAYASLCATFPFVVATRADSPIGSFAALIEAAKRDPGKLTFSSVGYGSTQHLTGELLGVTAGIKLTHVPYRGGMQPLTDLMSGRIDLMVDTLTVTGPAIRAGTIRGLGITSPAPWPALPEVTPVAAILPGFEVRSWIGIAAPAGTPPAIVAKLNAGIAKAVADPKVREQLGFLGVHPEATTPEATRDFVAAEIRRWHEVVDKAGIEKLG
jgi:tripartite-type tricarboxylate transporter receptor subunit TctC